MQEQQATTRTLHAAGVPFSFDYPVVLAESRGGGEGVIAAVSAGPRDYVAIREFAPRAFDREALGRELQLRMLGTGRTTPARRERHGGRPMLVVKVRDTERPRADRQMHVFTAGGRSWSIECRRTRSRAQLLDGACRQALDTLEFDGGRATPTSELAAVGDGEAAAAEPRPAVAEPERVPEPEPEPAVETAEPEPEPKPRRPARPRAIAPPPTQAGAGGWPTDLLGGWPTEPAD